MGNTKSKKVQREPDKFFERERWKEQKREEKKKKYANPANKRVGVKEAPLTPASVLAPPAPVVAPAPVNVRSYDDEALDRMRYQLYNDSDAFLLNNILLSVQFFENYERELHHIKNNPINEREHTMDEEMVRRHKHVFFADRLQECVQEHISYQSRRDHSEPLIAPRLFIIYDNVEASEPGDTSDYCAVLDAPFYKLRIEDCKESGFVKLKKLEVLESSLSKENEAMHQRQTQTHSDDSIYTDSEKESNDSDDYVSKGEILLQNLRSKLSETQEPNLHANTDNLNLNFSAQELTGRRPSGPFKQVSSLVEKNNISNLEALRKKASTLIEDNITNEMDEIKCIDEIESRPRKSILKNARRASETNKDLKSKTRFGDSRAASVDNICADDTETSGYRSNSSSRHNESSETDSDYGYSTITESTTPKRVELSLQPNSSTTSGVLPEECWIPVDTRSLDWSDDEDETSTKSSRMSISRNLFETHHYLSSVTFMSNFVDNFIISLGSGLGFSQEAINGALTQGASVYCDTFKHGTKSSYEVYPALLAAWPNAANQWIIRERKIIQNPRTNFSYQWPTRNMVRKAIGFGCLLVPIGFRPKRGLNPDQKLQWKIIFPAAERYLESCLAHSHMRCYLFALTLHKAFMENETSKIGIDASHIKNHLFWQCEDNYARWPEDRLGESLRLFLRSFYVHFGQSRFPNYFIENCNDFKSIPKPLLLKLQRKLADILESPVMHVLSALDKIKYNKKEFYPTFNVHRLYEILTCKNPLHILNPNIPEVIPHYNDSSDSEDDHINFWDKAKAYDKHYQWKKERQRQLKERRKVNTSNKKRGGNKEEKEINKNIILPTKMQAERRRLVLEFFIPHFIAMARSSEKFDAIKQAVIYLEQAHRLCRLLLEEPAGDVTANEYLDVIRDKLTDCQRKLAKQVGYKLPPRMESYSDRSATSNLIRKHRPKYEHIINQDSPSDGPGIAPFTFVDVHVEDSSKEVKRLTVAVDPEESKL